MLKKSFSILVMMLCVSFLISGCFFNDDDTATASISNGSRFVIEGMLPAISEGAALAPDRAADFGTSIKYSIGLYQVNGSVEGSEIEGSLVSTGDGKYSVSVPFASNDVSAILAVRDKGTGCVMYKTLIGMLPKTTEARGGTITLKNVFLDSETTARTLMTIEKNMIPSVSMISGQTGEISFISIPAYVTMSTIAPAPDITAIATAVKQVASIISSSRVSDGVKKQILPSANTATQILSAFVRAAKSEDINVKSLVPAGTSVSVNGTLIDKNVVELSETLIASIKSTTDVNPSVAAVLTPEFTPATGSFNNQVAVSISCATPGAQIRYTLNGSVPDASSPLFTSSVILTATATVNAYAFKDGMNTSAVASARYVIDTGLVMATNPKTYGPFTYIDNGTGITIIGYKGPAGPAMIPPAINARKVTAIGEYAFYNCTDLTSVLIPSSVTSIGAGAFQSCYGLVSVTIPAIVTSIGDSTFMNCGGLTSVTIPASVTSIGNNAFFGCGIKTLTIHEGVTSIGMSAFFNCKNLTSVTIPSSVTSIGASAFSSCDGLVSVTIPSSVTSIGDSTFSGCSGLTSVTIPSSVTSIGASAFSHCSGLTSVTIPSSVTSIGASAFSHCSSLTSVTIPEDVTSIGDYAFSYCTSFVSVYFRGNNLPTFGTGVFTGCTDYFSLNFNKYQQY